MRGRHEGRRSGAIVHAVVTVLLAMVMSSPVFAGGPDTPVSSDDAASTPVGAGSRCLAGQVIDPAGRPLAGAVVTVVPLGANAAVPDIAVMTSADGRFVWPLPDGRFRLRILVGEVAVEAEAEIRGGACEPLIVRHPGRR